MSDAQTPVSLEELGASRREWIEQVLRPWCARSELKLLKAAAMEWHDFAGRVDVDATLWTWAWERHPQIVHEDLPGVNETHQVTVTLRDDRTATGYPDGRRSRQGQLLLVCPETGDHGPFSIDDVVSVERLES